MSQIKKQKIELEKQLLSIIAVRKIFLIDSIVKLSIYIYV